MALLKLRHVNNSITGFGAALAIFLATAPSLAQGPNAGAGPSSTDASASDTSGALTEIVVTARRRDERLIDVPVAVTGVSAEVLNQVPTTSLTQIGNLVPGVSLERIGGGSSGAVFTIRGVGQLAADYNSEQPVALNIDGVQVTKGPVGQLGFFDLESVQVLKGPQALFFGKNSPAGVVSIESASPGKTLEGYVRAGYEFSASTPSIEAAVSVPVTDTLSIRVAGHYDHDNSGYIQNRAGPIANPFSPALPLPGAAYSEGPLNRNYLGRITAVWRPTDNFDATLKVLESYHHDWGGNTEEVFHCEGAHPTTISVLNPALSAQDPFGGCSVNHQTSIGAPPATVAGHFFGGPSDGKPYTETKATVGSLQLNYRISDAMQLTSVTGVYRSTHGAFDNYDDTVYAQALDAESDRDTQLSQEFRLTSSFSGPLNFAAGVFYEHDKHDAADTDAVFPFPAYPIPGPFFGVYNTVGMQAADKAESYSAFGQIGYKVLENLELAAGARYSHDSRSAQIQNNFNYFDLLAPAFGIPNPFSPVGVVYNPSVTASNVSPEATLTWHPIQDMTVYGAYKTGYLAPAIGNPANVVNYSTLANPNAQFIYEAEKVKGFEFGVKGYFLDSRLSADLTIYHYDYTNLQVATFHPDTLAFAPGNAGKARDQGIEFQSAYKITRDLTANVSLTYWNLKFLNYTGAQCYPGEAAALCPNGTQDLSGQRYGDGPFTAKFGFSYSHEVWTGVSAAVSSDISHTSASPRYERDPYAYTPDYTTVNASLRVFQPNGPWEFALIATNVNNSVYYKNFIFKPLGLNGDIGAESISLPRLVTARVEYKF
jgi:outer membrane receptor protein involved in Fe transport